MNDRWTLLGKKALVTGATKGIGLAIAQELLELKAEVMVVARNTDAVHQQVLAWQEQGFQAHGVASRSGNGRGSKKGNGSR